MAVVCNSCEMFFNSEFLLPARQSVGRFLQRNLVPVIDFKERLMQWNFRTEHEIFRALIGDDFGPRPELEKEKIRKVKLGIAESIAQTLQLESHHTILDLGSGTGYLAAPIAAKVKIVHCADISPAFLKWCRRETSGLANVQYHLIRSGDLSCLNAASIDKGYSEDVFIHFNLFDITLYLRELNRVLKPGGQFLCKFHDSDCLDVNHDVFFQKMQEVYRQDRSSIFTVVQWNSGMAITAVAKQYGFRETKIIQDSSSAKLVFLEK